MTDVSTCETWKVLRTNRLNDRRQTKVVRRSHGPMQQTLQQTLDPCISNKTIDFYWCWQVEQVASFWVLILDDTYDMYNTKLSELASLATPRIITNDVISGLFVVVIMSLIHLVSLCTSWLLPAFRRNGEGTVSQVSVCPHFRVPHLADGVTGTPFHPDRGPIRYTPPVQVRSQVRTGWGVPTLGTAQQVFPRRRAVWLLRSRRRVFLFSKIKPQWL